MQAGFNQPLNSPAGNSESINSYLRLAMNLLKVYEAQEAIISMVSIQTSKISCFI